MTSLVTGNGVRNSGAGLHWPLNYNARRSGDAAFFAALRPLSVYGYTHSFRSLHKRKLTAVEQEFLHDHCQRLKVYKHGDVVKDSKGAFRQINIYPFAEQLQLICADREACEFLARRDDRSSNATGEMPNRDRRSSQIIYLEIALDMILPDERTLCAAFAALKRCLVQKWNGKHEPIEFDNGGMSTGRRWNGRYITAYRSKPSPVTGEVNCLHIEYRICSAGAVRKVEVESSTDLPTFDYVAFWEEYLDLREVDIEHLGRHRLNKCEKSRRQRPGILDCRVGQVLWRANAYDSSGSLCTQAFMQNYGGGPFLKRIPIRHLLPTSRENELFS
jgi:hypothetical protein